jgi:2-methylcitrate dehydratase PrpD
MARQLTYGTVSDRPRKVIHVLRVIDEILGTAELDALAAAMQERLLSKHGEQTADVVIVQGASKETLRLFGDSYPVSRVRAAMFNAAISWRPIELD